MSPQNHISILGCGFIGLPLAKRLVEEGFSVKGSTTSPDKMPLLKSLAIAPFLINLRANSIDGPIQNFLDSDILVVDIPFKRTFQDPFDYKRQMEQLVLCLEKSSLKQVVFTSSTSIYPSSLGVALEDQALVVDNERSKALLEAENVLRNNAHFKTTILRLAGLFGDSRMISNFLKNKEILAWPESPVNLVHQDDCVEVIFEVIRKGIWGETFNVCSDQHPTRKVLYSQLAAKAGLPAPQFNPSAKDAPSKIVSNEKLKQRLNYQFKYSNPADE